MTHPKHPHAQLTPAMRGVLDRMARAARLPMHALSPAQARQFYEAGANVLDLALPHDVVSQSVHIPVRDGERVPAELTQPKAPANGPRPVLLYLHGGGFTVGSVATHRPLCHRLAHLSQGAVLSVDYRLAPTYRFPTASNDAWDALQWVHTHACDWGLDPTRIAVGGDSAGGTLSLGLAHMARDAGLPLCLQLLFYPGCLAQQDSASHRTYGHGFLIEKETIDWFFAQYLNDPTERQDWRFAPLQADDWEGVAPAWIGLAECDPLVDEGIAMADALRMGGVPVDLEIYRGVVHEFIKMGRAIPEALTAHEDAARALRRAWGL